MYLHSVISLQSGYRAVVSRRETKKLWFQVKGTKLKYACLMLKSRSQFLRMRRACVALQCAMRRRVAKAVFKQKKAEAKDVGKLQQSNESLKAEIESLRARAAEDAAKMQEKMRLEMEALTIKQKNEEHEALVKELAETKAALAEEKELRAAAEQKLEAVQGQSSEGQKGESAPPSSELLEEITTLRADLEKEQISRVALENEVVRLRQLSESHSHGHGHHRRGSGTGTRSRNVSVGEEGKMENHPPAHHHRKERQRSVKVSGPSVTQSDSHSTHSAEHDAGQGRGADMQLVRELSASGKWDDDWDNESDDGSIYSDNSERHSASYKRMSFSEKPMPEYHRRDMSSAPQNAVQALALMGKFERNLDSFKSKLAEGVKVECVETNNGPSIPLIMKFVSPDTIKFSHPPRRFTIFASKSECAPIKISEILECIPGAYHKISSTSQSKDDSQYLTIVSHSPGSAPRNVSILLESRDERNTILTGLRTLVSDVHMSTSNETVETSTEAASSSQPAQKQAVRRRSSFKESILAEAKIEDKANQSKSSQGKPSRRGSLGSESASEVKRQLLVERSNYEKLMVQMLVLTNDLNEREDQIIAMKKREAAYEEQLASKEKMYEQDAKVRMQLGKRLEDVLMDKEEIKDELDNLKAQLEMIRSGLR